MLPKARQSFSLIFLIVLAQPAQALTDERAADFVRALVTQRDRLSLFVHPDELSRSNRLGIRYDGVDYKFLIAYDLGPDIRSRVDPERVSRTIQPLDSVHNVARLVLTLPGAKDSLSYLFEDSLFISPLRYYARNWKTVESEHFRFFVSDSTSLREYHAANLERFFEGMADQLRLTEEDRAVVRSEKLNYYLCSDDAEVQRLTGFTALGMYNMAYDAIITSYHAHYHELVHQLVNFKLRTLPPYTHSFLQEGLAVALGGRGGKEPGPILELGQYLCSSGMVDTRELFADSVFDALDPSMSYPVCGLYNHFLMQQLGWDRYLELYRHHSGTAAAVRAEPLADNELPPDSAWRAFLQVEGAARTIQLGCEPDWEQNMYDDSAATISAIGDRYCFALRDSVLLSTDSAMRNFRSSQFVKLFGNRPYGGEKYAVVADPQEISVYNLYTGNLIAKCVGGFLNPPQVFAQTDGRYRFSVLKSVLEDEL